MYSAHRMMIVSDRMATAFVIYCEHKLDVLLVNLALYMLGMTYKLTQKIGQVLFVVTVHLMSY